jgi:Uma2 family endonuclease
MDAIDAAGSDLEVFRETFYLRSAPLNSALLPDVMAVADRFQPLARAASEPVIVVEVTTPGTIGRDWWEKRLVYQRFESLSSYLLVHRDGPRADLFRRNGDRWRAESLEDDAAQVVFPEIGLTMRLGDVYGTVREHTVTR